jgi:hypothetical protein
LEIPSADTASWNIAEGSSDGKPRLIRYRVDLAPFIGNYDYQQRLVIIWDYESDNSNGMPTDEQSDLMKSFENALVDSLDIDRLAVLAFVLTFDGSREWHFYVREIEEVGIRINGALAEYPKLPIHLQVESDPEWEQISTVLNICGE